MHLENGNNDRMRMQKGQQEQTKNYNAPIIYESYIVWWNASIIHTHSRPEHKHSSQTIIMIIKCLHAFDWIALTSDSCTYCEFSNACTHHGQNAGQQLCIDSWRWLFACLNTMQSWLMRTSYGERALQWIKRIIFASVILLSYPLRIACIISCGFSLTFSFCPSANSASTMVAHGQITKTKRALLWSIYNHLFLVLHR